MASGRAYTTEEVLDEIFADPDSDFENEGSDSEDESYVGESVDSSENEDLNEIENQINNSVPPRGRGNTRGHGNTRGRGNAREWSQDDRYPVVHDFTAQCGLQVQLPNNADVIDYLTLFLTMMNFLIFW